MISAVNEQDADDQRAEYIERLLTQESERSDSDIDNREIADNIATVQSVPLRTIEQVHRTKRAEKYKRFMDMSIYFDLIMIAINFQFWTEFSFDSKLQAQADKLKRMF